MQGLSERISRALVKEEMRAERFANNVRLFLLVVLTGIALINSISVSKEANLLNFSAIVLGYAYGGIVYIRIRRSGYNPSMKYLTSCLDIGMVFLLLFFYTTIEIPSVALKNYVFVILYPLIGLTAFRYDAKLTWITGGTAVFYYLFLVSYLHFSGAIAITWGGYDRELFSQDVTFIGQATKVIILSGFIALMAYLAKYSRLLIIKLVRDESSIREKQEQIEYELRIASHVQKKFVPTVFPEIKGLQIYGVVEQGKFVGGDYCDFVKMAEDRLLVVVADVSGNGIPAALIMAEVRATINLIAETEISLERLVNRINRLLFDSTDKKVFVTLFVAEINTSEQTISYVNAGHPCPLVSDGNSIYTLKKGTIPLGVSYSLVNLGKQIEPFQAGSCFIAYTDGLVEQFNSYSEQFGEERLLEYFRSNTGLDVQNFAQLLLEQVKKFNNGRTFDDDVGFAIVKFLK